MVVKVVVIRPKLTPEKKEIRGSLIYGGEGGSYSSKTDSREKRNHGQSDFLRQKIW
jgi:hypothetical protein